MITCDMIMDAHLTLVTKWGDDGRKVIETAAKVNPFNGNCSEFLNHCVCCGGNWIGMYLTGIKELYPTVWDAIPESMGHYAFDCVFSTMILCGIDTSE